MRIEFQTFGFDRFMAGGANAIARAWAAAEQSIDLTDLFMIPARQAVEQPEPILISATVHPLGVLFDLVSFALHMPESYLNAFPPLPKPIGTWDSF